MAEKKEWEEIIKEIAELCDSHGDSISDFRKCREFNRRMSAFLMKLEEMKCHQIADRVMDFLISCSPKEGSRCENALSAESVLKRIKKRAIEEGQISSDSIPAP